MTKRIVDRTPRICKTCEFEFIPSSRHLSCTSCVRKHKRIKCKCGNLMTHEAKTCRECKPPNVGRNARTKTSKGYISIRIDGKNVLEHRYVMEQIMGRPLKSTEQVHHMNCIKWDNRPDNLELWVRAQPTGARAKDLVAWAKSLLNDYEAMYPEV